MLDVNSNFYDVQKEFNKDQKNSHNQNSDGQFRELYGIGNSNRGGEEEEGSYLLYKRWEEFFGPRVYPSGKIFDPAFVPSEYARYRSRHVHPGDAQVVPSNWSIVGPDYQGCVGNISFVRFHPTDSNTIYAGAASGGLWKSVNGGVNWVTNTDTFGTLAMSDMAFDPANANIMYLATGGGGYATGLLKSTDGGISWNVTGLNNVKTTSVIVNPINPLIVLATTSGDVYRSADGGISFQQVFSGVLLRELMFNPVDPDIVYVVSWNTFYRSTDGGMNFNAITSGLPPAADIIRLAIATTPADPAIVYVLASSLAASDFYGLYLSADTGLTFTLQSNTPNIVGSQGWFALSIAVSPVNPAEVIVGGLNIFRSLDSGVTWTAISSWNVSTMTGSVHVDIHSLQFHNASTIYAGCDGGVFRTWNSGSNWTNLSQGLQVTQSYSVGISQNNAGLILIGTQDNGTKSYNGTTWTQKIGGDGANCFIDWATDSNQYASLPQGWLAASYNNGTMFNTIGGSITETTNKYLIPWLQDPDSSSTLYAGYTNVWKSTDKGSTWVKISNFASGNLTAIAVCSGYNRCLCAISNNKIYRTTDGGINWTNITGSLPVGSAALSDVVIRDADTNKIWVSFSGLSIGNKIFETPDGGNTWNNISGTLPNIPGNTLVYQKNSPDGLYLGMDIGVYYRDTILNTWSLFNTGLPNCVIRQLKIQQAAGKLRASTYGRGIWESDLFYNTTANVPNFTGRNNMDCFIELSPNPTHDGFTINFNNQAVTGEVQLFMYDQTGREVFRENVVYNKSFTVSKRFNPGIYFIKASQEGIVSTAKLVVQ